MQEPHETQLAEQKLMGVGDVAKFLGVSQATVYRMIEHRLIPFYKLPRYIRFRRSDIDTYLASCLVKPINEYGS